MLHRRLTGVFFDKIAEIVGRQVKLLRTPVDSQCAVVGGFARSIVVVDEIFERHYDVFVDFFACDELAVVETAAVVEKEFDCRCDDHVAVAVIAPG